MRSRWRVSAEAPAFGLASDEAQNIVNARPIRSMDALAGVPQVRTSALQKIKDYIPRWGG
ncbi:MAG: hypothetical protein RL756_468 [Pseudomonadota bacterium]|jgi:DNA uptake protein ComE-like DNA-binding protein